MPKLLDEMERYLDRWQDDLPAAWRTRLDGVAPKFDAIPRDASLDLDARIVPVRRNRGRVFYALEGIDPPDVNAVILGNDPYPDPIRATGRSFEQGDLTEWTDDLSEPGRVTRSLLSLVCAAVALRPDAKAPRLDSSVLCDRRGKLLCGIQKGEVVLPPARSMFENLTGQGVLWLNRTPTMSVLETRQRREGSSWRAIDEQRKWHRALWRPVTRAIVSSLMEEARGRPVVFALFGEARNLRTWIKAEGRRLDVPNQNLRIVESGHPSVPRYFFYSGNPLRRINDELTARGCDPIDWNCPAAGSSSTSQSAHTSAIMDRTVGKYRNTLRQLAQR